MDINNKRILILGAYGQVGQAITKMMLRHYAPGQLILSSLRREEAEEARALCEHWASEYQPAAKVQLTAEAGNILLSAELEELSARLRSGEPLEREYTDRYVRFVYREYSEFAPEEKRGFTLYRMLTEYKPHIVVDCVNTATGLAYQDIFSLAKGYIRGKDGALADDADSAPFAERLLLSAPVPALVRHIEILNDGMRASGTELYLKVGTTGTGGMGLNIPYTHSESKPSRTLMSKSAIAGASSMLFLLMNRTAGNPVIKEIKPAALIGWKSIGTGPVRRGGRPLPLYDCPLDEGLPLSADEGAFAIAPARELGGSLSGVYIDTGENGVFSADEFEAITSIEQMELVTAEDVARAAVEEILGESTGFDVVGSLSAVVQDSSYRGGVMRNMALERLRQLERETGQSGVAYELLGPPRLSKLLWEAHLIKLYGRLGQALRQVFDPALGSLEERISAFERGFDAQSVCEQIAAALANDEQTRSRIISIGIPICSPELRLAYGPNVALMRAYPGESIGALLADANRRSQFLENGAVVLLPGNIERWKTRLSSAIRYHFQAHSDHVSGSDYDYRKLFSVRFDPASGRVADVELHIGELIGWLFVSEEKGSRRRHFFEPGG